MYNAFQFLIMLYYQILDSIFFIDLFSVDYDRFVFLI